LSLGAEMKKIASKLEEVARYFEVDLYDVLVWLQSGELNACVSYQDLGGKLLSHDSAKDGAHYFASGKYCNVPNLQLVRLSVSSIKELIKEQDRELQLTSFRIEPAAVEKLEEASYIITAYSPRQAISFNDLRVSKIELDRFIASDKSFSMKQPLPLMNNESIPKPLAVFQSMDNLTFNEVTIRIDPDHMKLRVSARDKKDIPASFNTLGLLKKDSIVLNSEGRHFFAMANGAFDPSEKGAERAVSRISKSLREAFGTKSTPFSANKPHFKLFVPKDRAAKQGAIKRTTSYKDDTSTSASDFLRLNDPHFDSNDPSYSDELDIDY